MHILSSKEMGCASTAWVTMFHDYLPQVENGFLCLPNAQESLLESLNEIVVEAWLSHNTGFLMWWNLAKGRNKRQSQRDTQPGMHVWRWGKAIQTVNMNTCIFVSELQEIASEWDDRVKRLQRDELWKFALPDVHPHIHSSWSSEQGPLTFYGTPRMIYRIAQSIADTDLRELSLLGTLLRGPLACDGKSCGGYWAIVVHVTQRKCSVNVTTGLKQSIFANAKKSTIVKRYRLKCKWSQDGWTLFYTLVYCICCLS